MSIYLIFCVYGNGHIADATEMVLKISMKYLLNIEGENQENILRAVGVSQKQGILLL